ncbi:hypothetical protein [Mesorhizobium sp. M0488]
MALFAAEPGMDAEDVLPPQCLLGIAAGVGGSDGPKEITDT